MADLEARIDSWIDSIRDEYVKDVIGAVCIPSVSVKTEGPHPFGDACAQMLDYMEQTARRYGFGYQNHEYYCATSLIEGSEGKGEIGMFGHTDVVPAGEGWSSPPFEGHEDHGYIVGRGSNDNKGSTFACLYAMRFFSENGIRLKNNVRLLFGCNEESGMEDVIYYGQHHPFPDITLVPDSWWPVSCSEKGVFLVDAVARVANGNLVSFETVCADNTVPNRCVCTLAGVDIDAIRPMLAGWPDIQAEADANGVRLDARGIGTHASFPEGSKSAVATLAAFLLENDLLTGEAKDRMAFVAETIADYEGKALDIDFRDDFAGGTTHVLTNVKLADGGLAMHFKICYPAAASVDKALIRQRVERYFDRDFLRVTRFKASGPHFVEQGHPVVEMLCRNASQVFDMPLKPFSQAGGTYTWFTPNSLAAGPAMHSRPQRLFTQPGHGGAHQPDECMEIDLLLKGIKVYILSLIDIDNWLSEQLNGK